MCPPKAATTLAEQLRPGLQILPATIACRPDAPRPGPPPPGWRKTSRCWNTTGNGSSAAGPAAGDPAPITSPWPVTPCRLNPSHHRSWTRKRISRGRWTTSWPKVMGMSGTKLPLSLLKFRRFLLHERGQGECKVTPFAAPHTAGLPGWLVQELTRFQHSSSATGARPVWNEHPPLLERAFEGVAFPGRAVRRARALLTCARKQLYDYAEQRLSRAVGRGVNCRHPPISRLHGLLARRRLRRPPGPAAYPWPQTARPRCPGISPMSRSGCCVTSSRRASGRAKAHQCRMHCWTGRSSTCSGRAGCASARWKSCAWKTWTWQARL